MRRVIAIGCLGSWLLPGATAIAQSAAAQAPSQEKAQVVSRTTPPATTTSATTARAVTPPPGYVIGPDDVLGIVFWREKDLSAEVVVRPDVMITLPLLEDIKVTGLTPAELKQKIMAEAGKLVTSPSVSVIVKQVNSRKVFITGHVAKPGSYALTAPMTVVQLIALSGGLLEFADRSKIRVMRIEKGTPQTHLVNYKQLSNGEDLKQNIELQPGDTVIVP
jgi:polysaccharide export outer membrane protein